DFTRTDAIDAPKVVIVNQACARKFKLGANPVGRHMDQGNKKYDMLIVGLARDAKYSEVKDSVPPIFFVPYMQDKSVGSIYYYVRTSLDPKVLLPAIPRLVAKLDPNLP